MSGNPPPRRAYGLPSNPRQASSSLKHTKSQPDLTRRSHESPVAEPLPTSSYSRPSSRASTSRAREAPARLPSRSIRAVKFTDVASPARSDSAPPPIGGPLRNRSNQPWSSVPSSRASLDEPPPPPPPVNDSPPPASNHPDDPRDDMTPLWKKMATMLTVNVSKALAATIDEGDGEATPFGQESRLTKAMKSYHLSKARNHSDLPDWLFTDTERRRKPVLSRQSRDDPPPDKPQAPVFQPTHRPFNSQGSMRGQDRPRAPGSKDSHKGGTNERLKALRERGRHVEKSASTSHLPPASYREQRPGYPVALPSRPRPLVQR